MQRGNLFLAVALFLPLTACDRSTRSPATSAPAPSPEPSPVQLPPPPSPDEQETMTSLAQQGAQAFPSLSAQSDLHHGATWFQGAVPSAGSTAYLYLGKLGESGASTLRFVVRYEAKQPADLGNCTVSVDGREVGLFSPAPNRVDQPTNGSVRQLADIHFDEVRPIVLAMISGQSATIRTADGKDIALDREALDEMRRVLSAYLHLQGGAP